MNFNQGDATSESTWYPFKDFVNGDRIWKEALQNYLCFHKVGPELPNDLTEVSWITD